MTSSLLMRVRRDGRRCSLVWPEIYRSHFQPNWNLLFESGYWFSFSTQARNNFSCRNSLTIWMRCITSLTRLRSRVKWKGLHSNVIPRYVDHNNPLPFLTCPLIPVYSISSKADGSLRLHYFSNRQGLFPIVKGLVSRAARVLFEMEIFVSIHLTTWRIREEKEEKRACLENLQSLANADD